MSDEGSRYSRISNAFSLNDGEAVQFRIERQDGQHLDLTCDLLQVADIFASLGQLARDVGVASGKSFTGPAFTSRKIELSPIPADGIGFQHGHGPNETLIVMNLAGFAMAFAVPNAALLRVADDLAKITRTLSASGRLQ